jgi:hypothetical protein
MPSWALVGTVDRVILPATQLFLAERAGARIVKVKASPWSLISRPGAVTGLIVAADRATRGTGAAPAPAGGSLPLRRWGHRPPSRHALHRRRTNRRA